MHADWTRPPIAPPTGPEPVKASPIHRLRLRSMFRKNVPCDLQRLSDRVELELGSWISERIGYNESVRWGGRNRVSPPDIIPLQHGSLHSGNPAQGRNGIGVAPDRMGRPRNVRRAKSFGMSREEKGASQPGGIRLERIPAILNTSMFLGRLTYRASIGRRLVVGMGLEADSEKARSSDRDGIAVWIKSG